MGDSTGEPKTFENVEEDLRAAVDHFLSQVPEVTEVAIWGLCDAASAALFYARLDARVSGIVLLNPWVHDEQSGARVRRFPESDASHVTRYSKCLDGYAKAVMMAGKKIVFRAVFGGPERWLDER